VLFGATGDLAKRMVLPALYRLACERLLPRQWLLVGNGRGDITHENEIDLFLVAKKPGPALDLDVARAAIPLASLHGADPLPPYVRLIHDVLLGDRSLFTRPDVLAAVWQVAEPLLTNPPPAHGYAPGSWGPAEASELIAPGQWLLGQ